MTATIEVTTTVIVVTVIVMTAMRMMMPTKMVKEAAGEGEGGRGGRKDGPGRRLDMRLCRRCISPYLCFYAAERERRERERDKVKREGR